jgi:hypothetical protein
MSVSAKSPPFFELLEEARRATPGYPSGVEAAAILGIRPPNYWRMIRSSRRTPWPLVYRLITRLNLPLEVFFPPETILAAAERLRAAGKGRGPDTLSQ